MKSSLTVIVWGLFGLFGLSGCSTIEHQNVDKEIEEARESLRSDQKKVAQQDAKTIAKEIAESLAPKINITMPEVVKKSERRFDVNAQLLPASALFQTLVDGTGFNLLLTEEVRDPVTISLKDVTLKEALDALRSAYGYEYEIQGRLIKVSRPKLISKTFQVNYLLGTRKGQTDMKVSSGSVGDQPNNSSNTNGGATGGTNNSGGNKPNGSMESSRITTNVQNDFWGTLNAVLTSIAGTDDGNQVVINPQAGLVFVKTDPKNMREIERYLEKMQNAVSRQVMLEAKIIEVNLKDGFQSGVNWALFDSYARQVLGIGTDVARVNTIGELINGSQPTPLGGSGGLVNPIAASGGLGIAFTTTSFSALMSFLETQGNTRVLSTPRVATLNNQKAILKVGNDDFFVTNVTTNTTSNGTNSTSSPSISVQSFFSGIALDVTPQIDDQGFVTLHIHPSVSQVSEKNKVIDLGGLGVYNLPLASSSINETDSIVRIKDGQIVAIGGLMRIASNKENAKVPGVADVPLAGSLFKRSNESVAKTELVILMRPTIIERASDWNIH